MKAYDDALRLALKSGEYFNVSEKSEYVETLLAKCIDQYKEFRLKIEKSKDSSVEESIEIDPKMEDIIEKMFSRCFNDSCFEQAVGIALDTRRIDFLERTCNLAVSVGKDSVLNYTFNLCVEARNISSREFRSSVMEVLVKSYNALRVPDYANMCFCLQFLNQPTEIAKVLYDLIKSNEEKALIAYQIAFDLVETENQGIIINIVTAFNQLVSVETVDGLAHNVDAMEIEGEDIFKDRVAKLKKILSDGFETDLKLNFLFKNCKTDASIIQSIRTATENKSSVLHNACVISHAFTNAGTTNDEFLRNNINWLGKAKNWAKFTAVGSMGVVHKGHVHESMNLLNVYLPPVERTGTVQASMQYSEAGALFALGLIHSNQAGSGVLSSSSIGNPTSIIEYLSRSLLNNAGNDVCLHGGCLGLGLAAMGTGNEELFAQFRNVLFEDSAVAGEGAALGIGLLMAGQSDSALVQECISELLNHAHDTSHEKIVRGLSLAIAMMVYGKEEGADVIIEQLIGDRDPVIRYGGVFAIALAYCGTSDNEAIKKLLHLAVSDVSDDVRRVAVIGLGFLSFRAPETVPKLIALLSESFNIHVRYGSCLAVGISCAGTGLKEAIDMLNPMLEDPSDIVRQGAFVSMAMVLQEVSEVRSPTVKKFREMINKVLQGKHEPLMAKLGAIWAAGILDAGGRNVCISMLSRAGFLKMGSVLGLMMFLQSWYWYPLSLFLSLSFTPTVLIGLNKNFDIPNQYEVQCNAPLSMFAYPKVEEKKEDEKKPVATAVLSTTLKSKVREKKKEAKRKGLDTPGTPSSPRERDPSSPTSPDSSLNLERVPSLLSTSSYMSFDVCR